MDYWHDFIESCADRDDYHAMVEEQPPSLDEDEQYVLVQFRTKLPDTPFPEYDIETVWEAAQEKMQSHDAEATHLLFDDGRRRLNGVFDVLVTDAYDSDEVVPIGWYPLRAMVMSGEDRGEFEWSGVDVMALVPMPEKVVESRDIQWSQEAIRLEQK